MTTILEPTEYGSWEDCDYPPLDFPQNGMPVFDDPSYPSYTLPLSTDAPSSYYTADDPDMDWARNGSVSTASNTYSRQLTDSPVTEFSFFEEPDRCQLPLPDLGEPDRRQRPLPTPVEGLTATAQPGRKRSITDSTQPSKRSCSEAVGRNHERLTTMPAAGFKKDVSSSSQPRTKQAKVDGRNRTRKSSDKKTSNKTPPESSTNASFRTGSGRGPPTKPQLRTAARKAKDVSGGEDSKSPPTAPTEERGDEDDVAGADERRARYSHNLVEKQYRNRLNQQFESLLAVLPMDGASLGPIAGGSKNKARVVDGRGGTAKGAVAGGEGDDRRLSKAEVLDMARQRIVSLERENDRLKSGNDRLKSERMEMIANAGAASAAQGRITDAAAPVA